MKKLLAIFTAVMLVSCATNHDEVVVSMKQNATTKISKEQALKNLYSELKFIDEGTRAEGTQREVKSIKPLVGAVTRSGNALDNDLLYIVEFGKGQGSAVVAADTRLEPVIAVLDSDVLTAEDFANEDMDDVSAYVASRIEDYATFASRTTPIPLLPAPGHSVRDTIYRVHVHPLLTTKWDKGYPYNGQNIFDENPTDLPTWVVAVAQILKYYNAPASINNISINWGILNYVENKGVLSGNATAYSEVRSLMSQLMAIDGSVVELFQELGYSSTYNYQLAEYALEDTVGLDMIKESIIDRRPVMMSGSAHELFPSSHSWVVDGCLDYTARYIIAAERLGNIGEGETVVEYITTETDYNKIHCNFGRGGKCDGYYTYRAFNLGMRNNDIDESVGDQAHSLTDNLEDNSYNYRYKFWLTFVKE